MKLTRRPPGPTTHQRPLDTRQAIHLVFVKDPHQCDNGGRSRRSFSGKLGTSVSAKCGPILASPSPIFAIGLGAARPGKFGDNRIRMAGSVNQNFRFDLGARKLFFVLGLTGKLAFF